MAVGILVLVVIINFCVKLLLTLGTVNLCGCSITPVRLLTGAAITALHGGLCLCFPASIANQWWFRLLAHGMVCMAAFGVSWDGLRQGGVFTLLCLAMTGLLQEHRLRSIGSALLAAAGILLLCRSVGSTTQERDLLSVTLRHRGKEVRIQVLRDTGNRMCDPITGERILIIGPDAAFALTGLTKAALRDPVRTMEGAACPGLRLFPYSSVGNPDSLMLGMRISEASWKGYTGSVLVAFAPGGLDGKEGFDGLLGGQ